MSANIKPAASTALVLQDEGGTDVITISTSGNVGVGNGSPAQKLDVTGNINATGALTLGTALAIAEGGTGATDAATARINLGLGTAAAEDVGYFATAAQGSLADSAVQPGDDANTLGSGSATDGYVLTADGSGGAAWEAKSPIDLLSSGASIRKSDGTTAVLSESGGVVTLENVTNLIATSISTSQINVGANLAWNSSTDTYTANTTPSTVTKIHEGMKRCLLRDDGTVNYYLDPTDSTQKLDGTAADLTGADGNVMVEIPRFYFRQVKNGNTTTWEISDVPLAGYQLHPAFFKNGEIVDYRYIGAYDACLKFERSITAVADAGGGDITVMTSAQHPLYAGDTVTISGTTSYDGDYTVVTRASGITFTVTATFVATEIGTATGYVSGKNLDDMTSNIDTSNDALAVISSQYPLVGVTRDECRSLAANVGTGWRQQDFWLTCAVQMLYLVEYGTFYNQNELGAGNTGVASYPASSSSQTDSPHSVAGKSNSLGNASTDTTSGASSGTRDTAYMSYRGIENFFGNCWNWVDGINIGVGANYNVHVSNTTTHFADNTSTNYDLIGQCASANGYVQNISDVPGAFIPNDTTGASSSTYLTDYFYINTGNRVALFGGAASYGALAGAFCWLWSDVSSNALRVIGARLAW